MLRPKAMETFFFLRGQHAVRQSERKIFVKFDRRLLAGLGSELRIDLLPTFRIEQLYPRFRKITRGFVQSGTQDLGERIARLILEGQLLLPPSHQLAAMLLDQFVTRVRVRIEAKALVKIGR